MSRQQGDVGLVPPTVGTLADTDFLNKIGGIIS